MKALMQIGLSIVMLGVVALTQADTSMSIAPVKTLKINRDLSAEGKACITCHQQISPGQVSDWADSRHAHAGISCIDCHQVPEDAPHATRHANVEDTPVFVGISRRVWTLPRGCEGTVRRLRPLPRLSPDYSQGQPARIANCA